MPSIGPAEIILLFLWIGIAHLIASAARKKGYSYPLFFVLALFTWLIAAVVVLVISDKKPVGTD